MDYQMDCEGGGFYIYASSLNNARLTNIALTNIVGGGEEAIIKVESRNITADNILIENMTAPIYKYISYDSELDMHIYESYSSEESSGSLVFYGMDGITNITNIKVNNVDYYGYDGVFRVDGGDVNVENVSVTNSKIPGEDGSSININSQNNVDVNNIVLDNLSLSGYNNTYYDRELGKYFWEAQFESEGGPIGVHIHSSDGNATATNINMTNINDAGYELFSVYADNVTVDNVAIENVTPYFTKEYEYNRYLDEYLVESYAGEEGCQIEISADQNAKVTNIQITNLTTTNEFLQIEAENVTVENFTVKDSFISINQEGCRISADNLNISNFIADNIKQAPGMNETRYDTNYGKYVYDYETSAEGFGLCFDAKNVEADRLHFTNLQAGGEGILTIRADNLTVDDVLIENITSCYGVQIEYDPDYGRHIMTTNSSGDEGGILYIYGRGGLAQLTNVKVNNAEFASEEGGGVSISSENVVLENITLSNLINKGYYSSYWDKDTNQYLKEIYMASEDFLLIGAHYDVNITNMILDNVPTGEEGVMIDGENVTIIDSEFRNIKSENMYMETDSLLRQLITTSQMNYGIVVQVDATNVKIMGTNFENITVGGNNYLGFALIVDARNNTLIENCTFKDITGESFNRTDYDSSSRKYISEVSPNYGSAVSINGEGSSSIVDSSFINCKSDYGGAIYAITPLNITGSEFINCSANLGGAIYVDGVGLFVNNTLFKQNNAINGGAVFFTNQSANNTFYNATFLENLATANGGALYIYETTQDGVNIINASGFYRNHANYNGGAFFFNDTINRIVWDDYRWHNATASSKYMMT